MLRFFKTRTFRTLAVLAVLVAVYALAGFVFAPTWLRAALLENIPKRIGVTPAVGRIRVNPFLLQVTIDQFSLPARDGGKLLGFERLFVDFEISSAWHRAYSFAAIEVTSPYVGAILDRDGSLNLLELQPKAATAKPSEAAGAMPAIRIGSLKITQGSLSYEDRSRPDVFSARLEPVNIELRDFTTGAEGGKFTLTGASKLGERIEWHGHVSVQPVESDGEFRIDGLRVHTLWEYLEDKLNFAVDSGTVDLAATYRFSLGNDSVSGGDGRAAAGVRSAPLGGRAAGRPANFQLEVSKAVVSNLGIRPKDSDTDWITVPDLTATAATLDLAKRRVHVDEVSVAGLGLLGWLEPDGSINLLKLAASPSPGVAASSVIPSAGAAPGVTSSAAAPASGVTPRAGVASGAT
ncbi:MAG: DUF748 domain-containing protein, partial [Pseudomonadota bacterium]|nr:DUF748 domain-containing protein [Pseudomonadota bacterium]